MPRRDATGTSRARALRRDATEHERWLWNRLRGKQLGGHRFRQQHPFGPYILDFYCSAARLAVELDGSGHVTQADADEQRSLWLAAQGCA